MSRLLLAAFSGEGFAVQLCAVAALMVVGGCLFGEEGKTYSDPRWPDFEFAYPPTLILTNEPQWKFLREPVLRRMPDGSLLCLHYTGGSREPSDENLMVATRSEDDGRTWSPDRVVFDHPIRAVYAPELFVEAGPPRIFLHTFPAVSRYLEARAFCSTSDDSGKTWSEPVTLPGVAGCFLVRRGIALADGAWLFPIYWTEMRRDNNWTWEKRRPNGDVEMKNWIECCGAVRSEDQGATYTQYGYVHAKCRLLEPACVETAPGQVVMLMRADGQGRFYRAESRDGGRTWTPAEPSDIPAVASKVVLLKHRDAALMIFNPPPAATDGADGLVQRRTVALWVSRDGCRTWPKKVDLARVRPDSKRAVCYPDGFIDERQKLLFVAVDTYRQHFLIKVPLADVL